MQKNSINIVHLDQNHTFWNKLNIVIIYSNIFKEKNYLQQKRCSSFHPGGQNGSVIENIKIFDFCYLIFNIYGRVVVPKVVASK
jgi:hypothetical protein